MSAAAYELSDRYEKVPQYGPIYFRPAKQKPSEDSVVFLQPKNWGLLALPRPMTASRAGSIAEKLVKSAQEQLEHVRLGGQDLSNTL